MDGGAARFVPHSCPVCGGDGSYFVAHRGYDFYSCGQCRTVYIHPLPTPEFLAGHYQDNHAYYYAKAAKKLRRARARFRLLGLMARRGHFLDVGCHGGYTVEAAREVGFDAAGIDLDAGAIAYAREHYPRNHYYVGSAEELALKEPGRYALIECAEVLEHVPDGHALAAALFALLAPGGYLHLTTPDISHWRRPRDVHQWNAFVPPNHLIYYNPASLGLLLRRAGFTIAFRKPKLKPGIDILARKPRTAEPTS